MVIKKRPVITWLLNHNAAQPFSDIFIPNVANPINRGILHSNLKQLDNIRMEQPDWGLPELIMPSFEDVMRKSAPSFDKVMPDLFDQFSNSEESGILLCKNDVTLVYRFGQKMLNLWFFKEYNGKSLFNFHSINKSVKGSIGVGIVDSILHDDMLFDGTLEQRRHTVAFIANFVAIYVAVKKYVKVETVIVPRGKFTEVDGTPLEYIDKKKIINRLGQEVIVMDSKWFRKIINDNDIYVRGFWRIQNKKNEKGEWYQDLIFIDSFVRHGYHRNAKIEDE